MQSYKCTNIQVKLPMAYRFMLMTLSIIQPSLPLNMHARLKTCQLPHTHTSIYVFALEGVESALREVCKKSVLTCTLFSPCISSTCF